MGCGRGGDNGEGVCGLVWGEGGGHLGGGAVQKGAIGAEAAVPEVAHHVAGVAHPPLHDAALDVRVAAHVHAVEAQVRAVHEHVPPPAPATASPPSGLQAPCLHWQCCSAAQKTRVEHFCIHHTVQVAVDLVKRSFILLILR